MAAIQRGVHQRGADAEQRGSARRECDVAVADREQRERDGLHEHAGDDERLAPDAVGPVAGRDLADAPDARVDGSDEADLGGARSLGGEKERNETPGEPVIEVVDESRLRAGT